MFPHNLVFIVLASLLLSELSAASPEDVATAYGGIDMVSLATGYSRPLFDAPVSASIVSRRDVVDSGARHLAELLQTVTSYSLESPDGGRPPNIPLRGLEYPD